MQSADWVPAHLPAGAPQLLHWARSLAPVASLMLTDLRAGMQLAPSGEISAKARLGTFILCNLQLRHLSKDISTVPVSDPRSATDMTTGSTAHTANSTSYMLGTRYSSRSTTPGSNPDAGNVLLDINRNSFAVAPYISRACHAYKYARDRRHMITGIGSITSGDIEQYGRSHCIRQRWRRVLELRMLSRASDYAMYLLGHSRSGDISTAAQPGSNWFGMTTIQSYQQLYSALLDLSTFSPSSSSKGMLESSPRIASVLPRLPFSKSTGRGGTGYASDGTAFGSPMWHKSTSDLRPGFGSPAILRAKSQRQHGRSFAKPSATHPLNRIASVGKSMSSFTMLRMFRKMRGDSVHAGNVRQATAGAAEGGRQSMMQDQVGGVAGASGGANGHHHGNGIHRMQHLNAADMASSNRPDAAAASAADPRLDFVGQFCHSHTKHGPRGGVIAHTAYVDPQIVFAYHTAPTASRQLHRNTSRTTAAGYGAGSIGAAGSEHDKAVLSLAHLQVALGPHTFSMLLQFAGCMLPVSAICCLQACKQLNSIASQYVC